MSSKKGKNKDKAAAPPTLASSGRRLQVRLRPSSQHKVPEDTALHISAPPDGEVLVLPDSHPRSAPAGDTFPDPVTGEMDWEAVAEFVRGQESLRTSVMQDLMHVLDNGGSMEEIPPLLQWRSLHEFACAVDAGAPESEILAALDRALPDQDDIFVMYPENLPVLSFHVSARVSTNASCVLPNHCVSSWPALDSRKLELNI